MTTGQKIRNARRALGLTQDELGEMIGVQKAAINKYETGRVVNLKRSTIAALSRALGVSPTYLLDDDGEDHSDFDDVLLSAYHAASPGVQESICILLHISPDKKENALSAI